MKRLAVAVVLALVTLAWAVGSAGAASDTYQGAAFHPFTMDPASTDPECTANGVAHVYGGVAYGDCDPINVVFSKLTASQIVSALLAKGWTRLGDGETQYLHFANENVAVAQSTMLYSYVRGGTGGCPSGQLCRYHIRLWPVTNTNVVVAGVHFETGGFLGPHIVQSWEQAEARVCSDLTNTKWKCNAESVPLPNQAAIQAGPTWRGVPNDTTASLITTR